MSAARPGTAGARGGLGMARPPPTASRRRPESRGMPRTPGMAEPRPPGTAMGGGGSGGAGRQVADITYYRGEIRRRIDLISAELEQMAGEVEAVASDNKSYAQMEKRAEALSKEGKQLRQQLAAYNLMLDRQRSNTADVASLEADARSIAARNVSESRRCDQVLTQRKHKEQQCIELQGLLAEVRAQSEHMVASELDPQQQDAFHALQDELQQQVMALEDLDAQIAPLQHRYAELRDAIKQRQSPEAVEALQLIEALAEEQRHLADLKQAEAERRARRGSVGVRVDAALHPEGEREYLLQQVKEDNADIATLEDEVRNVEAQISDASDDIATLREEIAEHTSEKHAKYHKLVERDGEMTTFLEAFPDKLAEEKAGMTARQTQVTELLQHLSKNVDQAQSLPGQDAYASLAADLDFKEGEFAKAVATNERLDEQLARHRAEAQRVDGLEDKVRGEVSELREKIGRMRQELIVFSDPTAVKAKYEADRKHLLVLKQSLIKQRQALQQRTATVQAQHEAATRHLAEAEAQQPGVKKLRTLEQNNHVLSEYVAAKSRDSDYGPIARTVTSLVEQVNRRLASGNAVSTRLG